MVHSRTFILSIIISKSNENSLFQLYEMKIASMKMQTISLAEFLCISTNSCIDFEPGQCFLFRFFSWFFLKNFFTFFEWHAQFICCNNNLLGQTEWQVECSHFVPDNWNCMHISYNPLRLDFLWLSHSFESVCLVHVIQVCNARYVTMTMFTMKYSYFHMN